MAASPAEGASFDLQAPHLSGALRRHSPPRGWRARPANALGTREESKVKGFKTLADQCLLGGPGLEAENADAFVSAML